MKFDVFSHQNGFIKTKDKFPALVAGYGSGKTYAFCLKALAECGRNPGKTILLAEPTYPMVRDVLQPTLEDILHKVGFNFSYKASEYRYIIYWKGGHCNIILRSAENWRRWAGLNLAGFGIDEAALLKSDEAWKMGIARLRDGHHLSGWTTTTPEGFNWHYEWWKEQPKSGYELIQGRTTDNTFLPKEFIESLYENYDERLIKAYLHGEYVNLQHGQAYYQFDRRNNVKENKYNPSKRLRFAIDFNVNPLCGVVFQLYKQKPQIRIIDEIKLSHTKDGELLTERVAKEIMDRYKPERALLKQNIRPKSDYYIAYPDPAGQQRRTSAMWTDHQILKQVGYKVLVKKQAPRIVDRLNSVNKALTDNLIIDPRCKGLIKDFEQVVLKDGTRDIEKTNSELSHFTDAIGYAIDYEIPVQKPITKTYMA